MFIPFRKVVVSLSAFCVLTLAVACERQPTISGLTEDLVGTALLRKGGATTSSSSVGCKTIQSGDLIASTGETIGFGYDTFGYNYQAHIFNGAYSDADRDHDGGLDSPFSEVNLQMKWNDAWLSNKDCDGDSKLDRHYGFGSYIGSGAWLTNHDIGFNEDGDRWTYFVKIVAVPEDAGKRDNVWYTGDGIEIGPVIWGAFAVIQQVITGEIPSDFADFDLPFEGNYRSPAGSGLGSYK